MWLNPHCILCDSIWVKRLWPRRRLRKIFWRRWCVWKVTMIRKSIQHIQHLLENVREDCHDEMSRLLKRFKHMFFLRTLRSAGINHPIGTSYWYWRRCSNQFAAVSCLSTGTRTNPKRSRKDEEGQRCGRFEETLGVKSLVYSQTRWNTPISYWSARG